MLAFSMPAPGRYYTACFAGEGVGVPKDSEVSGARGALQCSEAFTNIWFFPLACPSCFYSIFWRTVDV